MWRQTHSTGHRIRRILGTWESVDSESLVNEAELLGRITIEPGKCGGRPCIRGMRIRVLDVLELLAAGETPEDILSEFPYLEPEDISASLIYAARHLDHPVLAA